MFSQGYAEVLHSGGYGTLSDLSLHYLRTGVTDENFISISDQIRDIAHEHGITDIVVHQDMYALFEPRFLKAFPQNNFRLLIECGDEKNGGPEIEGSAASGIVLDVNHFNLDSTPGLLRFAARYGKVIKEIHFSYRNHELFPHNDLGWLEERLGVISEYVDLRCQRFICEGTQKHSKNIPDLCASLSETRTALSGMLERLVKETYGK